MDTRKTNSSTEALVQFVDGHDSHVTAFGDNRAAERLYRKVERVVAAVHVLTSHISAEEPLRREIRAVSVSILAALLEMRDDMRNAHASSTKAFELAMRHLETLVRLAAVSSFISFQNADLVTEALDDLVHFLHSSQKTAYSESMRLSRELFSDVRTPSFRQESYTPAPREKPPVADTVRNETTAVDKSEQLSQKPSVRTDQVLSVLRAQPKQSIRDVAAQLPEYSEKMIQRELADLVLSGKVRKEGEKRWSTYSVA